MIFQIYLRLTDDNSVWRKVASLFKEFNEYLEAAKIQGFTWDKSKYEIVDEQSETQKIIEISFDKNIYLILAVRYKELFQGEEGGSGDESVPFELSGYLTEIDTGKIDADYMNSRFEKYLKVLEADGVSKEFVEEALNDLHKSFASLTQEQQKYANIFLHDVQRGDIKVDKDKSIMDYITEYQTKASNDRISRIADTFGLDETKIRNIMNLHVNKSNINEYGRFDDLKSTVDKKKAREYFEKVEGRKIKPFEVNMMIDEYLRNFILDDTFEIM